MCRHFLCAFKVKLSSLVPTKKSCSVIRQIKTIPFEPLFSHLGNATFFLLCRGATNSALQPQSTRSLLELTWQIGHTIVRLKPRLSSKWRLLEGLLEGIIWISSQRLTLPSTLIQMKPSKRPPKSFHLEKIRHKFRI